MEDLNGNRKDHAVDVNGTPKYRDERPTRPEPAPGGVADVAYRAKADTLPENQPRANVEYVPGAEIKPSLPPESFRGKRKTITIPKDKRLEKKDVVVPEFSESLVGNKIDIYGDRVEIHGEIARGGMGVVYLARVFGKDGNDYWAALKVAANNKNAADSLRKEIAVYDVLENLGCMPKSYKSGTVLIPEVGESPFSLSERVFPNPSVHLEGKTKHYFRMDPGTVLNMALTLYSHLIKINGRYVMHSDIKPENIMIRPLGGDLVSGKEEESYISRIVNNLFESLYIDTGSVINLRHTDNIVSVLTTPTWAPPEYSLNGDIELEWDQEERGPISLWDTYALSATLSTMLTGELPYEKYRGNKRELAEAMAREELPYDLDRIPEIPLDEQIWLNGRYDDPRPIDKRRAMAKFQQFVEMGTHPNPRKRATPKQILNYLYSEFNVVDDNYKVVEVGPGGRKTTPKRRRVQKFFHPVNNRKNFSTGEEPVNVYTRHRKFDLAYQELNVWYGIERMKIEKRITSNPEYLELFKKHKSASGLIKNMIAKQLNRHLEPLRILGERTYRSKLTDIKTKTGARAPPKDYRRIGGDHL